MAVSGGAQAGSRAAEPPSVTEGTLDAAEHRGPIVQPWREDVSNGTPFQRRRGPAMRCTTRQSARALKPCGRPLER
jgi:hypothetical protein